MGVVAHKFCVWNRLWACLAGQQHHPSPVPPLFGQRFSITFRLTLSARLRLFPESAGHFYGGSAQQLRSALQLYVDTAPTTFTVSSFLPPATPITLLAADNSGSGAPFTGNLAMAALGSSLTGTQQGFLYARIHAYMQAVAGAP